MTGTTSRGSILRILVLVGWLPAVEFLGAGCGSTTGPVRDGGSGGSSGNGGQTTATPAGGSGGSSGSGGQSATGGTQGGTFDVSPYVGVWKGTLSPDGNAVTMQVASDGTLGGFVSRGSYTISSQGTCTAPVVLTGQVILRQPVLDFSAGFYGSDLYPNVHVSLSPTGTATGTIDASQGGLAICGNTLTIGTTGSVRNSSKTFTLSLCKDCAVPTCTTNLDGYCDEPSNGTGLCFAGTDTFDCQACTSGQVRCEDSIRKPAATL